MKALTWLLALPYPMLLALWLHYSPNYTFLTCVLGYLILGLFYLAGCLSFIEKNHNKTALYANLISIMLSLLLNYSLNALKIPPLENGTYLLDLQSTTILLIFLSLFIQGIFIALSPKAHQPKRNQLLDKPLSSPCEKSQKLLWLNLIPYPLLFFLQKMVFNEQGHSFLFWFNVFALLGLFVLGTYAIFNYGTIKTLFTLTCLNLGQMSYLCYILLYGKAFLTDVKVTLFFLKPVVIPLTILALSLQLIVLYFGSKAQKVSTAKKETSLDSLLWFNGLSFPLLFYLHFFIFEYRIPKNFFIVTVFLLLFIFSLANIALYKKASLGDFLMAIFTSLFTGLYFALLLLVLKLQFSLKLPGGGFYYTPPILMPDFILWLGLLIFVFQGFLLFIGVGRNYLKSDPN